MLKRFRRRWLAGVVAIACVLTLGAAIWRFYPSQFTGLSASDAVTIRWLFLRTTAHMLEKEPLFGVGIGQYGLWSSEYAPPELFKFYASENAHNNFAQVAGELGLVGLAAFLFLLVASLMRGKRTSQMLPVLLMPAISASAVFVLTWLGGHPLLVPEVSYPFWLTLGLGAGLLAAESRVRVSSAMVGIVFAVLLTSIPFRIHHKTASLDMTRIRYGISDKGMMGPRGRLFVPAEQSHIDLPLRSRMATQQSPIEIDVLVEDRVVDTITMVDDKWLTRRIPLPGGGNHAQQIDLRLRRPELPDDDEAPARRSWVEIGDWSIISKPNG